MVAKAVGLDPELLRNKTLRVAQAYLAQQLKAARKGSAAFANFVLRDERTHERIKLAPMHRAWHNLIAANRKLLIWAHVESGKTQQVAIARTLWEMGRDPTMRGCILSNTHKQAAKTVRAIADYVEQSNELKQVWPDLEQAEPWSPLSGTITVKRKSFAREPTLQGIGVHGNILGARLDYVVVDDILDFENTLTETARGAMWDWFNATIAGRLTQNARVIVIGNAWHPEDAMHRWAELWGRDVAFTYPVLDPATQQPRWPERWSLERINDARRTMPPVEYARQLLCVAYDDASAKFKREWIDVALRRGSGKTTAYALADVPPGCKVYTGVDLAIQQHSAADLSVLFTLLIHPDGTREVLGIDSGRWSGPEIVSRIFDIYRRYQGIIVVENNAAQDFIIQFAQSRGALPIKPFTTGRNKAHPEHGVESLAVEMAAGKWIIPNQGGKCEPEVSAWIGEMMKYDPRAHTGDRLMASWFAREGARMGDQVAARFNQNWMSR